MLKFLNRFAKATAGLSAIEFAMIAPSMVVTFFGIAEVANYVIAARKVASIASTAADLVSQVTSVDDADMNDVMNSLNVILRPFNPNDAWIRISEVDADDDGALTIGWSDARNISPHTPGMPFEFPAGIDSGIVPPNQAIIMAEISFRYQTLIGMFLTNGMTVSDTFYLKPRRSIHVDRE
jgi:Flp pilus assembly protein TadG